MKRFTLMNRLLFSIMAFLACAGLSAQEKPGTFSVVPRVGVTVADLTHFDWAKDVPLVDHQGSLSSRFKAGAVAGAQVDYQVTDVVSASAGVNYALLGTRYPDFMVDNGDGTAEGVADMHMDLHYLQVPLLLNAYVLQGLALKAGVQVGFLLDARMKTDVTPVTIDAETGAKTYGETMDSNAKWEDMKTIDLSIPVGLSYEFEQVVLDARYNLGLTKVCEGFDWRNSYFTFTVGYRFEL